MQARSALIMMVSYPLISSLTHTALTCLPKFHELDLIKGNGKTIKVLDTGASKWEHLAIRLYFDESKIEQIRTDSHGTVSACRTVFSEWLQGKQGLRAPRTWDTVIAVLQEADLGQLADDLKEIFAEDLSCKYTFYQN